MLGNLTGESFLIAISGIVIVFIMLAVLCAFIPLISRCVQMVESRGRKAAPAKPAAPAAPAPQAEPEPAGGTYGGEVMLIDVDEKTAACIMAIVSHETGIPLSELIFKKIKAL